MITLDINSVANDYAELYEQPVGTVIKVDYDNYETVMERISENTPAGKSFEVSRCFVGQHSPTAQGYCFGDS